MAKDGLILQVLWEASAASVEPTPMAGYEFSLRAGVLMAVAAGRVRHESGNYRLQSQFVGKGEVRQLFVRG